MDKNTANQIYSCQVTLATLYMQVVECMEEQKRLFLTCKDEPILGPMYEASAITLEALLVKEREFARVQKECVPTLKNLVGLSDEED